MFPNDNFVTWKLLTYLTCSSNVATFLIQQCYCNLLKYQSVILLLLTKYNQEGFVIRYKIDHPTFYALDFN